MRSGVGCCAVSSCNFCITLSSIVISFRGLHHKNIKCVPGGDLHKRLADVEARDPTVAQPMLAPSQFPLTHDFDRQTQAQVPSCASQIVPQSRLERYRAGMCRTGSVSPSDAQIVCDGFLIEILEWNTFAKAVGLQFAFCPLERTIAENLLPAVDRCQ